MTPNMYSCCKSEPTWIFIYENNEVYTICNDHFNSSAHQALVKSVINFKSHQMYDPALIFDGVLLNVV